MLRLKSRGTGLRNVRCCISDLRGRVVNFRPRSVLDTNFSLKGDEKVSIKKETKLSVRRGGIKTRKD